MRTITLVRHTMPEVDAATDPSRWRLTTAGRAAALGRALSSRGTCSILASDEVKAAQTVALMTGHDVADVIVDPDFGEARRKEAVDEGFRERRDAWIRGETDDRHHGWESFSKAGARFDAAVERHEGDLIIGTHGMVLTAWLVRIGIVSPGNAASAYWRALGLPEVITIDR
ncbi:hypothetical protein GCM10010915_26050 [Microbacterium faecale]|uniref:Histidine phosphatase family protein n=1 Tax=Microbacterium faecale TaxID=1804630 RepID=A0A916YG05_9MICO|nr:histidine phosphatase family protein [Microbacterium faecale]GGD43742.1 hypothetical protein GCM10010915_26050 [Microbacterium faecale]